MRPCWRGVAPWPKGVAEAMALRRRSMSGQTGLHQGLLACPHRAQELRGPAHRLEGVESTLQEMLQVSQPGQLCRPAHHAQRLAQQRLAVKASSAVPTATVRSICACRPGASPHWRHACARRRLRRWTARPAPWPTACPAAPTARAARQLPHRVHHLGREQPHQRRHDARRTARPAPGSLWGRTALQEETCCRCIAWRGQQIGIAMPEASLLVALQRHYPRRQCRSRSRAWRSGLDHLQVVLDQFGGAWVRGRHQGRRLAGHRLSAATRSRPAHTRPHERRLATPLEPAAPRRRYRASPEVSLPGHPPAAGHPLGLLLLFLTLCPARPGAAAGQPGATAARLGARGRRQRARVWPGPTLAPACRAPPWSPALPAVRGVLLHGFYCNRGLWRPGSPGCKARASRSWRSRWSPPSAASTPYADPSKPPCASCTPPPARCPSSWLTALVASPPAPGGAPMVPTTRICRGSSAWARRIRHPHRRLRPPPTRGKCAAGPTGWHNCRPCPMWTASGRRDQIVQPAANACLPGRGCTAWTPPGIWPLIDSPEAWALLQRALLN